MSDVKVSEKGTFVQSLNPMTGQREWKMVPEDYDYQQEVARAAFADMLHDTERVNKNIRTYLS
jgi:protein arginine N-methyltransferase 7